MWKIINTYDKYMCSDNGDIKHVNSDKILSTSINKKGYKQVCIWNNGKRKILFPHRIVAQLFVDNPDDKTYVNHMDGNKTNNNASNLEWCTNQENILHAINVLDINIGGRNKKKVKCIETGEIFSSCCDAAKAFGVSNAMINMICNNKKSNAKGYHFEFC